MMVVVRLHRGTFGGAGGKEGDQEEDKKVALQMVDLHPHKKVKSKLKKGWNSIEIVATISRAQ